MTRAMEIVSSSLHIVICPWLAFGHLLPCLDLAERLALRGHRVSYVSTPRNIARLPPVRPAVALLIDFVALALPSVDGLPDGAESTNDISSEQSELHRKAFDGLNGPFSEFLGSTCAAEGQKKPDWIIIDSYHHWAAAAAIENQVPCAMLVLTSASILSSRPSETSAAPKFEMESKKSTFYDKGASGMSMANRCYLTVDRCNVIAIRSCLEWEPESLPLAATLRGKPVIPLGLLPPSLDGGRGINKGMDATVVHWLDAQPSKSVMYVAMGSEVPLSVEQVHELAHGLELARTRFLWALRKPSGVPDADILPTGFVERTHGQGLLVMGWVPQITVLAHDAVCAFLTHCGWNSAIEGLMFGRPLVMLPISNDQGSIARLMERRKVGVQVARNQDDGSFDREGIRAAVRSVVVEEEGSSGSTIFAANAKKLQEIVADRELHERYLDGFIQQLRSIAPSSGTSLN